MARFYVGQPVICVNANFRRTLRRYPSLRHGNFPVKGGRYVVRAYVVHGPYPSIVLRELRNGLVKYMDGTKREAGFWDERFEPATENQVQAIIAIATDVPDEIPSEHDLHPTAPREKEDA